METNVKQIITARKGVNTALVKFLVQQSERYIETQEQKGAWHSSHHLKVMGFCATKIYEWQTAPVLWNAVRFNVDKCRLRGQFIQPDRLFLLKQRICIQARDELAEWLCVPCHYLSRANPHHRGDFAERFV